MTQSFDKPVAHVLADSEVTAANTSRPTRQLENRTNYLKERLDAIEAGQVLLRHGEPVTSECLDGQAIYWDTETNSYAQALAGAEVPTAHDELVCTPTSHCLGIVIRKESDNTGSLAIFGFVSLSPAQAANLFDGEIVPGPYYLSGVHPGKIVRQKPPVSIPVLHVLSLPGDCNSSVLVCVRPQPANSLEDHVHYQFELAARPAGAHASPAEGELHTISTAATTVQGWLPVSAADSELVPDGAKFFYNLAAHPELLAAWPPLPVKSAVLEIVQPQNDDIRVHTLGRISDDFVTLDAHGIWWHSDCYNQVPWPTAIVTENNGDVTTLPTSSGCPFTGDTRLILSFTKMTLATKDHVVTSLRPAADAPFTFENNYGEEATTGDLFAKMDFAAATISTDSTGSQVLKSIADDRFGFHAGRVTEGLVSRSAKLIVASNHSRLENPEDPAGPTNRLIHQGIVELSLDSETPEIDLSPQVIRLGDAVERHYRDVSYIAFPQNRTSGIHAKFYVPGQGIPENAQLRIRAWMFGLSTGPFPPLAMHYLRIANPAADGTTPLPGTMQAVASNQFDIVTPSSTLGPGGTALPAEHVMQVTSNCDPAIAVTPGDIVFVRLTRDVADVGYADDVALVRISGIVSTITDGA